MDGVKFESLIGFVGRLMDDELLGWSLIQIEHEIVWIKFDADAKLRRRTMMCVAPAVIAAIDGWMMNCFDGFIRMSNSGDEQNDVCRVSNRHFHR